MNLNSMTWGLATLILALIIHIGAVLAIPYLSENDAWRRLLSRTEANVMQVLERGDKGQNLLWAFSSPDVKYAVCQYDITRAPVRVDFQLLRGFWSVALYDDQGLNFYAADGYDLLRQRVSLLLLGEEDAQKDNTSLPIKVPSQQGLIVLRAPIDNPVMKQKTTQMLSDAKCEEEDGAERRKSE